MATARTVEAALLQLTVDLIRTSSACDPELDSNDALHDLLEAVACRLAGTDVLELWSRLGHTPAVPADMAQCEAAEIAQSLAQLPYHPSLALSTLAQPSFSLSERRETGAYYTDFRLAQHLAALCAVGRADTVIDPSCGTGILLVAAVLKACGDDRTAREDYIAENVFAADLSAQAIRGARLALLSLSPSLEVVANLDGHLRVADSLQEGAVFWHDVAPEGFERVIGNPPWERLKATHHEYLQAQGHSRHYGAAVGNVDQDFLAHRERLRGRAAAIANSYQHAAGGEVDLYQAFLELGLHMCADSGQISMLLPAGLIRSRGTASLREALLSQGSSLEIEVFDNRSRFFSIDTRFKFIALSWSPRTATGRRRLAMRHGHGTDNGITTEGDVRIPVARALQAHRSLGVPEVRSTHERRILDQMLAAGVPMSAPHSPWATQIVRELDMTRDRALFVDGSAGRIPLLEGRMVHQFRCNAKRYVSGTGRKAIWSPQDMWDGQLRPQHWVDEATLPQGLVGRLHQPRVGFCDITGQTNERSMLAAKIPIGAICGNKVPTLAFEDDSEVLCDIWMAVANSFAFDWFVRRVITTTVNFFILRSIPFPEIAPDSIRGRRIGQHVRTLEDLQRKPWTFDIAWEYATARAEIDALVARAYGLELADLATMMTDFPLVDRRQPALYGEATSTVTRDLFLSTFSGSATEQSGASYDYARRALEAREAGAIPYTVAGLTSPMPGSREQTIGDLQCRR